MKFAILICLTLVHMFASEITLGAKLNLYAMPQNLLSRIEWSENSQVHVSQRGLWLLTRTNLLRLDKPGKALMAPFSIDSFYITQSGHPLAIVGKQMGLIRNGLFMPGVTLPDNGFLMSEGPHDSLYMYNPQKISPIYLFDGKMITAIAQPNQPVLALTALGNTVVFATKDGLFSIQENQPLSLVMPFVGFETIRCLTLNPQTAEIFLSTSNAIYSINNSVMIPLVTGIGGTIGFYDNRLWIADSLRRQVYILAPQ